MKINKDLTDAVMMLSFIALVLIGTSEFENDFSKNIVMVAMGFVSVASVVLRIVSGRQNSGNNEHSH
ncbi:MAG: hypothetical protein JXR54_03150 [Tannerellaceae bacterium]|jgi:hypothetical protein|nr:hypothetical protein [Tannerellaceae bacterium]MBP7486154.1 hypothetical protein [Parabacteroides sp.]MBP8760215.1 hypothetical protein [Parabacteroides sp.]MBP9480482.1 hypothetical protein [Parabacteroides sp.]MBP9578365.1 hypothetical protein [Parabacteroides sp.]